MVISTVAALSITSACGDQPASPSPGDLGNDAPHTLAMTDEELFNLYVTQSMTIDYLPESRRSLYDSADIVAIGRIIDVEPGRIIGPRSGPIEGWTYQNEVFVVRPTTFYKGAESSNDILRFESSTRAEIDAPQIAEIVPRNSDVLVFLGPINTFEDPATNDDKVLEYPDSWAGNDQVLELSRTQGFVIENPDGPPLNVYGDPFPGARRITDYLPEMER